MLYIQLGTKQEVFDTVCDHMLAQNKRAQDEGGGRCWYRQGDLKCAVGCLIPDDQYSSDLEAGGVQTLAMDDVLRFGIVDLNEDETVHFLSRLQQIHDRVSVEYWTTALAEFATLNNLDCVMGE